MAKIGGRGGIIGVESPLRGSVLQAHDETAQTPLAAGPSGDPTSATEISDNVFVGTEFDDNGVFGEETDDTVRGLGGNDYIWGGFGGIDRLEGGAGDDLISVEDGDIVVELADEGIDTVQWWGVGTSYAMTANVENLRVGVRYDGVDITGNGLGNEITGDWGDDTLRGGDGADSLDGTIGHDRLIGGAGNDTYWIEVQEYDGNVVDFVVEAGGGGTDTIHLYGEGLAYQLAANVENLILHGYATSAVGNGQNNEIQAFGGDNTLDGGAGADTLAGGTEDDTYLVGEAGDAVVEAADEGVDTVLWSGAGAYAAAANVEIVRITGTATQLTGNGLNNELYGAAGADSLLGGQGDDLLDGGAGTDTLGGGQGDDTYVVSAGDQVSEAADQGTDTIRWTGAGAYTLGDNVEVLRAEGGASSLTGNGLNNEIYGSSAADTLAGLVGDDLLDGGGGADSMTGGAGADIYVVDVAADQVVEAAGGGVDLVRWTGAGAYAMGAEVENLRVLGAGSAITGNGLDNQIFGGGFDDSLDGAAGADRLEGGLGLDVYSIDDDDTVVEAANGGVDTVRWRSAGAYVTGANIENAVIVGSASDLTGNGLNNALTGAGLDDILRGLVGDDTLNGGNGNDTLEGGAGADVYVARSGDVIVEAADSGVDTVRWQGTQAYVLGDNLENAAITGAATSLTGNGLDNVLTGAAAAETLIGADGDDSLNGQAGADRLEGGLGDDVYFADVLDTVVELAGGGIDEVRWNGSGVVSVGAEIENLTLLGGASDVSGNGLDNALTGGGSGDTLRGFGGADTLSGGLGRDTLIGGLGDDTYIVDDRTAGDRDIVSEAAGQGTDTVIWMGVGGYTMDAGVENFLAGGFASSPAWGNALGNVMTAGVSYSNGWTTVGADAWLHGEGGDDTLRGAAGHDSLDGGIGNDLLLGKHDPADLPGASDEDTLDGGAGADTMAGGLGADTYWAEDLGDVIVEDATPPLMSELDAYYSYNLDTVYWTGTGQYVMAENVEHMHLREGGFAALGNARGNVIYADFGSWSVLLGDAGEGDATIGGAAGDDTVLGGTGADALDGGDDDDRVDGGDGADTLHGGAGDDLVRGSDIGYGMDGSNDRLFGDAGNDILDGGRGADRLAGGDGDDDLFGDGLWIGDGDDTLTGGAGTDRFSGGRGANVVTDFVDGEDFILRGPSLNGITWAQDGADTLVTFGDADHTLRLLGIQAGAITAADFVSLYAGDESSNALTGGNGGDLMVGGGGQDTVNGAGGADDVDGGAGADSLTGGGGNDTVTGGAGADTLNGGTGLDAMAGGGGNDVYQVGAGDSVSEDLGEGVDTVVSTESYNLGANLENLTLGDGGVAIPAGAGLSAPVPPRIDGRGNRLDNAIEGSTGANRVLGEAGRDALDGNGGADTLFGGKHNDVLNGGVGNDVLFGEGGRDQLVGGAGADVFLFRALTDTGDRIFDFAGADSINLAGIDADDDLAGDQAFHFVKAFKGADGEAMLTYNSKKDITVLSLDANGDKLVDFELVIDGRVTANDDGWIL